jgi:hypothetical protein
MAYVKRRGSAKRHRDNIGQHEVKAFRNLAGEMLPRLARRELGGVSAHSTRPALR